MEFQQGIYETLDFSAVKSMKYQKTKQNNTTSSMKSSRFLLIFHHSLRNGHPPPGRCAGAGLPLHRVAGPLRPGRIATEGAGRRGLGSRHGAVGSWGRTTEVQLAGKGLGKRGVCPNFIKIPEL